VERNTSTTTSTIATTKEKQIVESKVTNTQFLAAVWYLLKSLVAKQWYNSSGIMVALREARCREVLFHRADAVRLPAP
jgi:hypothetical protein